MQPNISIRWQAASIPKSSSQTTENEDAIAPPIRNGMYVNNNFFQCAVADGATRSSFSRAFAHSLVQISAKSEKTSTITDVIHQARNEWHDAISKMQLTWPATEKVNEGAYSTILWLRFYPRGTGKILWSNFWQVIAVGDTCLFQFRREQLVKVLPVQRSIDFHNHPALIGSRKTQIRFMEEWEHTGTWVSGDDFFVATDAMAKWILQQIERGKNPEVILKDRLARRSEPAYFDHWIHSLRIKKEIRDDDTSIVWIKMI